MLQVNADQMNLPATIGHAFQVQSNVTAAMIVTMEKMNTIVQVVIDRFENKVFFVFILISQVM